VDAARQTLGTNTFGAVFLDERWRSTERTLYGMREDDFDEWDQHWRPAEPVFHAMLGRGVPVHNWQVYREDQWNGTRSYLEFGKRLQIYHYMAAPIFGPRGRLVGALNFCRRPQDRPFDAEGIAAASVLSGFVSATLARVTELHTEEAGPSAGLSFRELETARLAAAGQNNVEIALRLGIARETVKQTLRRVYRKLDVNGRAHMATVLARHSVLF
jgi:DNA-binding CsgD family transcriptional regulator